MEVQLSLIPGVYSPQICIRQLHQSKAHTNNFPDADLSNKIGKLGAESAVNKVRADKLESEVDTIKEELGAKIEDYKEKLANVNVDSIEKENKKLSGEIEDIKEKLSDARKENIDLSTEVDNLRSELIDLGNYKEEVESQIKNEINGIICHNEHLQYTIRKIN